MKKLKIIALSNLILSPFKWAGRQIDHVWCLFVHGVFMGKHKMHKAYGPYECQVCGKWGFSWTNTKCTKPMARMSARYAASGGIVFKNTKTMIRFIDLKGQITDDDTPTFAFYCTVSCCFKEFDGNQTFDSIHDFAECFHADKKDNDYFLHGLDRRMAIHRYLKLIPDGFFGQNNTQQ